MPTHVEESPEESLYKNRSRYLRMLVDLVPPERQAEAERILIWLDQTDELIRHATEPKTVLPPYIHLDDGHEPITAFLNAKGSPALRQEIIEAVIAGGWKPQREIGAKRGALQKSINDWLKGIKSKPPKFKRFGNKIGLIGWDETTFKS